MVKLAKEEKKTKKSNEEEKKEVAEEEKGMEETKDADATSDQDKGEEDKNEDEEEQEDEVLFSGPLNNEQQAEVEERSFQQMQVKMQEAIEDSIQKARFLLKMMIPDSYKKEQAEELQKELSRRQSENVQLETKGSGMTHVMNIKKH